MEIIQIMEQNLEKKRIKDEIRRLKAEQDAIILAHYYVEDDIQEIADFVGDSFALAKKAESITVITSYSIHYTKLYDILYL